MKSIFEQMDDTYRHEDDYLIPNLALPDELDYQIGKYGHMRHNYLKEHRLFSMQTCSQTERYIGTLRRSDNGNPPSV